KAITINLYSHADVVAKITDPTRVSAVVSFLNARRDRWYDPRGGLFGAASDIDLLDSKGRSVAFISFGGGGLYQSRPTKTFVDSDGYELALARTGPPDETQHDADALCALLGGTFRHETCEY
ncbi:MAG TPA: hypothetical protein VHT05_05805, partial [Candidatus Elarobacter sp.]|nr:hypothetical protein [Candidatus Elarobacter sp.]